jgi:xanthine dehydrogenase accessory factor
MDWLETLRRLEAEGTPSVLVTLVSARGSTPREAGCKMVVTADGLHGTIGGGNLEFQSVRAARALLVADPGTPVVRDFPLGPALGQCCGGHATVLFETIRPVRWRVALFGAGHVGRELVRLLERLPCRISWIDSRPDAFPPDLPANVTVVTPAHPAQEIAGFAPGTMVLVMTHDHQLDYEIVSAALNQADLGFIGLIGSETKRARFASRLARAGMGAEAIGRLVCPIGIAGAGGKLPAEIAIAVVAQMLQMRDESVARVPVPAVASAPHASLACAGCGETGCAVPGEGMRQEGTR